MKAILRGLNFFIRIVIMAIILLAILILYFAEVTVLAMEALIKGLSRIGEKLRIKAKNLTDK